MMRFKLLNAVVFIVLGGAIAAQIVRGVGLRFEALPGLVLGLAMVSLGAYRIRQFRRSRR